MKSYVTMETKVCPICCKEEDSGAILMDTRMRDTFEQHTATGWHLCAEHRAIFADGYVALVECSNDPGRIVSRMEPEDALRTGRIMHLKLHAADALFSYQGGAWPRTEGGKPNPLSFCPPGVIEMVEKWAREQGVEPIAPEARPGVQESAS